jgi:hypothetical protein
MDHMGHSTQHAALVYQHANLGRQKAMAERITEAVREEIWPTSGPADDVAPVRQLGEKKSHPA